EALRGSHRDFTSGPLGTSILILAIPMVLEMVMESVFAVVDVFFVARLGADAVATVGITESMLAVVYAIAIGLAIGATAMVARRFGEGDREGAAHAAAQALIVGLIVAVIIGVSGAVLAPRLLATMVASPEIIATGSGYTRMMFAGNASILLLFLINAVFRGAGDAAIAMRVLWLANILNIVLGPCLIFGLGPFPRLGVTGAAVATTIGRSTGVIFAASRLLRGKGRLAVRPHHWRLDLPLVRRILRLSASGTVQVFIGTASWIGLVRIISQFGADAVAGYTIGIRVIVFALFPAFGISNAAATMVGQALGAGKPERAERAVWVAGGFATAFLGSVGVIFVLFAPHIVAIFTSEPQVAAYASQCLRIIALGFLFYGYGMVFTQSFNGAGDTQTPTLLNLFCFWLFEIPLAWLLADRVGMGPTGVFIAMTGAFSLMAVAGGLLFRGGRWKTRRV
ncbi:MAG TPA: MATE family efflux transporter, partial [Gemmatimonadaceae bacterium]|nr:MATE family efflux transporter [Gemmatimonadaceae bacterium]